VKQNTLERHILVTIAVGILRAAGGSQTKKLGEDEQVVAEGGARLSLDLLLGLGDDGSLLLLDLLRQSLLELGNTGAVLEFHLLMLSKLLLQL